MTDCDQDREKDGEEQQPTSEEIKANEGIESSVEQVEANKLELLYSRNTITFLDTNILWPSEQWSIYKNHLDRRKSGSGADPEKNLSGNIDIPTSDLERAIMSSEFTNDLLDSIKDSKITTGVIKQVKKQIQNNVQNIEWSGQNFLFTQFNAILNRGRDENYQIYNSLLRYKESITRLKSMLPDKEYSENLKSVPYFLIKDFFKDLADFFDVRKENHNYDEDTDIELASTVLFEGIAENRNVRVISNDQDILNTISAAVYILFRSSPLLSNNEHFNFFFGNMPKIYTMYDREKGFIEEDLLKKGETLTKTFKGFTLPMGSEQIPSYHKKATDFTFYLSKHIKQLDSLLKD